MVQPSTRSKNIGLAEKQKRKPPIMQQMEKPTTTVRILPVTPARMGYSRFMRKLTSRKYGHRGTLRAISWLKRSLKPTATLVRMSSRIKSTLAKKPMIPRPPPPATTTGAAGRWTRRRPPATKTSASTARHREGVLRKSAATTGRRPPLPAPRPEIRRFQARSLEAFLTGNARGRPRHRSTASHARCSSPPGASRCARPTMSGRS